MGFLPPQYLNLIIYFIPLTVILGVYWWLRVRRQRQNAMAYEETLAAGLTEPPSLHPIIDPSHCLGCGSCVKACPERIVLGLVDRKAKLINPAHCIGHGACKRACPTGAITLVFGTQNRGIDIPAIDEQFETNVPGVFIAGELGGMGLIRNAITQGWQAMNAIAKMKQTGGGNDYDVIVIGAGPAGFSATLAAMEKKLRVLTLEQDSFGGTVAHYPRGKIVMTAPVHLPIIGKTRMRETTKEALMSFWTDVAEKTGLKVNYNERVDTVTKEGNGFIVKTTKGNYSTHAVLLSIGRRGTPRKLGVPGEEHEKVVYRLIDPQQYRGKHVLVVGGGDAALEAATSIAREPDTTVTLSYRSASFSRAKEKNRELVAKTKAEGRLNVLLESVARKIDDRKVTLEKDNREIEIDNDAIIVCAGGILPTKFLQDIGIEVETKYGTL
jgi:thioredoxin reductase/NAD-dependent dihydropyrimidine dehydrogenase PreA subunit